MTEICAFAEESLYICHITAADAFPSTVVKDNIVCHSYDFLYSIGDIPVSRRADALRQTASRFAVVWGALLTYPAKGCDCLYSYNKELNFHAQRVE